MSLALTELTAGGRGAIAVLELRGPGALQRISELSGRRLAPGRLALVQLRGAEDVIDEALVRAESEDAVEIHLHGSPATVRALAREIGAADAESGALALELRAARLLARVPCESAARTLLDQFEGALRGALERALAAPEIESREIVAQLLERGRVLQRLLQPALVVLLGPPNAGKSTLFNALLGSERALVTDQAGTTRDLVAERAHFGAYPVDLVDGPGERPAAVGEEPGAELEREGARLALELAERADLTLWLDPAPGEARAPSTSAERAQRVRSRCDLETPGAVPPQGGLALSARADPGGAAAAIAALFRTRLDLPCEPWVPGAAVPFEVEQLMELQRALGASSDQLRASLAALLAPRPSPASAS
jgi:tRNA modification GTPase